MVFVYFIFIFLLDCYFLDFGFMVSPINLSFLSLPLLQYLLGFGLLLCTVMLNSLPEGLGLQLDSHFY